MLLDQNPETIIQETKWFPDLHPTTLEQAFIMEGQDICNQIIQYADPVTKSVSGSLYNTNNS